MQHFRNLILKLNGTNKTVTAAEMSVFHGKPDGGFLQTKPTVQKKKFHRTKQVSMRKVR